MNNETLLVSLTSHTPRINTVINTLLCLYKGLKNYNAKIVFVLSEDEFPYHIDSLPEKLKYFVSNVDPNKFEIIFDKGNIRAHKKLMPTLEKYPDNDILCVDDDKYYGINLLDNFINTHKKYPNDVIVGRSHFRIIPIDGEFISVKMAPFNVQWESPLMNLYNCKQASGLSGTLYPHGTFTNPKFFDRELMMKICEHSDEDWQFMFNIIDDRTLRTGCKIIEYPDNNGYTECALCNNYGQVYYEQYYKNFNKIFPEFYDKLEYLEKQFEAKYPELSQYNIEDIMK